MYSDNRLILQLLSLMKQHGIRRVVISPGSRHYPLIRSIEQDSYFVPYSVVDERSAAFFALGLIQSTGEPVAICCTSGTSAINYGSAVAEAFYQGLPLVVLTSDRLPELLGQKEEQMFRQHDVYEGFIKYEGQLKEVKDAFSEWYCNRIINEAFLELDHNGRGPVHLNFPIETHHSDLFQTAAIPKVRKISRIRADDDDDVWASYASRLENKNVMIVWGQANPMDDALRGAVDRFAEAFDCVIVADKLSNCHHPRAIESAFLSLRAADATKSPGLAPDIVISLFGNYTFNGELKGFLRSTGKPFECWDIGTSVVSDPFRRLTTIFEASPAFFFKRLARQSAQAGTTDYFERWARVEASLAEPEFPYGEIYTVGRLMHGLPANSVLQIANSLPIRLTHLFRTDPSVKAFCNRGVNGIDGCMSTAVGFAATADEPVFLVIGDLTFFYDMNALWNRHLSRNLRILMLNNEGGGVMHVPLQDKLASDLARHVSAGHATTARGWAESLGFRYLQATSRDECDSAIATLTDLSEPGPILVEAFSKKEDDVRHYRAFMAALKPATRSFSTRLTGRIKRQIPDVFRRRTSERV